jgi:hypothetical protein
MNDNKATKSLKATLLAEYPDVKFSVRKTRCNGWVGQVIEVNFDAEVDLGIYSTVELWQLHNFGYSVEVNDLRRWREMRENGIRGSHVVKLGW